MTKNECVIVTAYTGISMLQGEDIGLLYKYAEERFGYPIMTHDMASEKFWEKLKHESENDFFNLCMNAVNVRENIKGEWLHDEITMYGNTVYTPNAKCSVCDCYVFQESNFCPNCGAKMRGES